MDVSIIYKGISEIIPYEDNPRNNEDAVQTVAQSIQNFGFNVPIIVDSQGVIIAGHTRYKASLYLGLKKVPCIIADWLSEDQVKAFRLVDNKTSELSTWNTDILLQEFEQINMDMDIYGFDFEEIDWDSVEAITEENYEQPDLATLCCPFCGAKDKKGRFLKTKTKEE